MALTVKILEKGAGTKTCAATANLGGLITSESTGYTGVNCSNTLYTKTEHYWYCVGTSGTSMSLDYTTATACGTGKKVYIRARLKTTTDGVDSVTLRIAGTTGGAAIAVTQNNPVNGTNYTMSGIVTMDASYTGDLKLRFFLTDSSGATDSKLWIYDWQAIDLTEEFGAGSEPTAAELDDFYTWRLVGTYKNYNMYTADGDYFYFATKITAHGLTLNDIISALGKTMPVYPLNANWVITPCWGEFNRTAWPGGTCSYWTKVDHTSDVLAKSISINLRTDIDGGASLAFKGTSTWQPKSGMSIFFYDDAECLFSGYISQIKITELNTTNWRCDCTVSSSLHLLTWVTMSSNYVNGLSTADAIDELMLWDLTQLSQKCFWRGSIDAGQASVSYSRTNINSVYDVATSLCKSAGMVLSVTADRRINARQQTITPPAAPRNITDAAGSTAWDLQYSEDLADFCNYPVVTGGYGSTGSPAVGIVSAYVEGGLTQTVCGHETMKSAVISDSTITNGTDATAAAELYFKRFGKVIPGVFSFTTDDLDYRPGMKITVDIDKLGMTAAKTMHIDSVTIYDVDGVNLLSSVACSNRDSTDFAVAPNVGANGHMSNISAVINSSITDVSQRAGTFTPALRGSTTAGTWAWTTQLGYYCRIGNMCYVLMKLVPSSISGSPTGNLMLTGLPFTAMTSSTGQFLEVLSSNLSWGASMDKAQLLVTSAGTTGTFYGTGNNIAMAAVAVANITAADDVRVEGWYQCI